MHHSSSMLTVIFVATVGVQCQADSLNATQWIWGNREAVRFDAAKSFDLPSPPKTASLKWAVDFCTATIWLNDEVAGDNIGSARFQTTDVLRFLKQGSNLIRLAAKKIDGPAAIVFELHVVMEDGREQTVRSGECLGEGAEPNSSTCQTYGDVGQEPWWNIKRSPNISVFDEYNQWEEAVTGSAEDELASFQVADGFKIELVYSALPEHGSWVSMAIDDQGRILLGKEDSGILRLAIPWDGQTEPILETLNDELKGVQGILVTENGLIGSANRSKGLFRLDQSANDDSFGETTLLRETDGGDGDHGRHAVASDSDGHIYVIHGDSIQIPDDFTSLVPITNAFQDEKPAGGHVIQTDNDGEAWKVFCSGLRNPYGLTLNDAGEFFTYDADAERHTGMPWYRPTRIVHLMPGVDYGWRSPKRPWPEYLPDSMPPIARIGRGSPTSLRFGYASHFPPAYRRALFALDWSYGRILAVHMVPMGSTYSAHAEVLVRGRPFSVCDLGFDKDGSMLVITGGRDTKSRLYRLRYVGSQVNPEPDSQQIHDRLQYSATMRNHRRQLESLFDDRGAIPIGRAWGDLAHPDLGIRSAARILLEHQPASERQDRLWSEQESRIALPALLAFVRTGPSVLFPKAHHKLRSLSLSTPWELQLAIRIESLIDTAVAKNDERSSSIRQTFDARFPTGQRSVDRELCRLLVNHHSEIVVERTLGLLADETDQIDKFHYLFCLADATTGWDSQRHDEFFRLLSGAEFFITDEGLDEYIGELVDKAMNQVPESRQSGYRDLFDVKNADTDRLDHPLPWIHRWTVPDIMRQLGDLTRTADIENGAKVFQVAHCNRCHRFGTTGRPFGPDLSTVSARFSREHILDQIVTPSKTVSSQYRNYTIALTNGQVVHGQVVYNGFRESVLRVATDPMALHETKEIQKEDIDSFRDSGVSPMPERLLDTLSIEQIADLLAYFETGVQ